MNKGLIPFIINMIKNIWKSITEQPAKEAAVLGAVHKDSTAADINRIAEVFENYKRTVKTHTSKLEKAAYEEVDAFLGELREILQEKQQTLDKYQIRVDRIDRKMNRILSQMEGSLDHEISKAVSLDNPECRRIMGMVPGGRKEQEMTEFFQQVMQDALENFCQKLRDILEELFEELEEELPEAVSRVGMEVKRCADELANVNAENYMEEQEKLMEASFAVLAGCTVVEKLMEVH